MRDWWHLSVIAVWAFICVMAMALLQYRNEISPHSRGRWILTHILGADHPRMAEYLLARKASAHYDELILLKFADVDLMAKLRRAGYLVSGPHDFTGKDELLRGEEPILLVTSPWGEPVFAGGYGKNEPQDLNIVNSFFGASIPQSIQTLSCGTAMRLQRSLNPRALLTQLRK